MDGNFTKIELKHIKLFVKFLKKNGVYNIYIKNLSEKRHDYITFHKNLIRNGSPEELINLAFNWSSTKEGAHFWEVLHYSWNNIIQNEE
jgi:hypothetical protein